MKIILLFFMLLSVISCTGLEKDNKKDTVLKKQNTSIERESLDKYILKDVETLTFEKFIYTLENSEYVLRQKIVDANFDKFIKNKEFPIINGDSVSFLYKGKMANIIAVTGDFTNNFMSLIPLKNIEGTDLAYKTLSLDKKSAVEYKFYSNGDYYGDKLNKKVSKNEYKNSILEMGDYKERIERKEYNNIKKGTLIKEVFENKSIINDTSLKREVNIYLPSDYNENKKYKVIYFCDGKDYIRSGNAKNILDYLIFHGEIEPLIGVFINSVERENEYIYETKDKYIDYFVNKLMPDIESRYSISQNREDRILVGDSFGGDFVIYLSYKYPEKFKNIIAQSGNFMSMYAKEFKTPYFNGKYDYEEKIYEKLSSGKKYPVKVFLVYGSYEIIGKDSKVLYNVLNGNKSVEAVKIVSYPQGHGFSLWGDTLGESLKWILKDEKNSSEGVNNSEKEVEINIDWQNEIKNEKVKDKKYYFAIGKRSKELFEYDSGEEIVNDILRADKYVELIPNEKRSIIVKFNNNDYYKYFIFPFYDINNNGKVDYEEIDIQSFEKENIILEKYPYFIIKDWIYFIGPTVFEYKNRYIPFFDYNFIKNEENSNVYIYPFF